ncbi:MAG: metallophosphoesterase [Methanospirillum sp.]|nr:metallophosphoesterase [Methanospirillum sp.]
MALGSIPPRLNRFFSVTILLSLLSASLGAVAVERRVPEVTELAVDGAVGEIIFIADPHVRDDNLPLIRETIRTINAMDPDLVLIGGDFVFGGSDDLSLQSVWGELEPPTYAVLGNHDYRSGDTATGLVRKLAQIRLLRLAAGSYDTTPMDDGTADGAFADRVATALEANGVRVLRNEVVELRVDGRPFRLVGVDDAWAGRASPPLLEPTDAFTVYLIHEPDCAAPWDADLILAGHTHGGQFLPAGVADRLGLSGRSRCGGAVLYVTRGIGTSNLPREIRATTPEIVRIVPPG